MSESIGRTAHGDAPLAQAKSPNAESAAQADASTEHDDTIVGRTVTINRPRRELYDFWRNFSNLALFMENIERIDIRSQSESHWVVKAPAGKTVEWDSIITVDIPGHSIKWSTTDKSEVRHSGSVEFRESRNGRGTEVTATIIYDPPGGTVGKVLAKLFQREPKVQARQDLRRFKQLMETGEISTSQPQDAAPRA